MTNQTKSPNAIELLFDGCRGIYIPQAFAQSCITGWTGISAENREILLAGPEHELYWEAWDEVLNNAVYEQNGYYWNLHQDGDLWAYCRELMSDEEKRNFGFDEE